MGRLSPGAQWSGCQHKHVTGFECPFKVRRALPAFASHTMIFLSIPALANRSPSGLQANESTQCPCPFNSLNGNSVLRSHSRTVQSPLRNTTHQRRCNHARSTFCAQSEQDSVPSQQDYVPSQQASVPSSDGREETRRDGGRSHLQQSVLERDPPTGGVEVGLAVVQQRLSGRLKGRDLDKIR